VQNETFALHNVLQRKQAEPIVTIWRDVQSELDALAAADLLRRPVEVESACGARVRVGGRDVVCLCSNDYLGLANDPLIKAAAIAGVERFGVGAGASRLVSGTQSPHARLERRLAAFKGAESAVVTATGWMANHVAIHAVVGAGDLILCDKLNHASIVDACLSSPARTRTYPHGDTGRLADLLRRHRGQHRRCLIVTDSLFSMDGDLAPLAELADLKERHDAVLMIDDAHATGVLGETGRGAAELLGVEGRVDVVVGTLSKAIGVLGGFVAGPAVLIDAIRNTGRPYLFTTALPAALCQAAEAALEIIESQPHRRRTLLENAAWLRRSTGVPPVSRMGVSPMQRDLGSDGSESEESVRAETVLSDETPANREHGRDAHATHGRDARATTPILPVLIGPAADAVRVSRALLERGFLVPAIRPPTVPKNTSRLRISLTAAHTRDDLQRFTEALAACL